MKYLKTILIVSLTILFTLLFLPQRTNETVQAAPVVIECAEVENSDVASADVVVTEEYTAEPVEHEIRDISEFTPTTDYYTEDFIVDCVNDRKNHNTGNPCGMYAQCMIMTYQADDYFILQNSNGFEYTVNASPEDGFVGEIYACLMYDNGTIEVTDDIVIDFWYDRPDVWFN